MSDEELHDLPEEEEADEQPLSLQKLSDAYAELLSPGDAAQAPDVEEEEEYEEEEEGEYEDDEEDEDEEDVEYEEEEEEEETWETPACEISPRTVLEAMLFVGNPANTPLSAQQVASRLRGVDTDEVVQLVQELNADYEAEGRPYEIVSPGDGYCMALREEFGSLREKFHGKVREARLSQTAIDVLALVAYNQPVTRTDVDKLRDKPSGPILTQLVRRQLLRIERSEDKSRTVRYFTTDRFLDLFGLENVDDLPQVQEME